MKGRLCWTELCSQDTALFQNLYFTFFKPSHLFLDLFNQHCVDFVCWDLDIYIV